METTISKRSRNLSIEWTNRPVTIPSPSGRNSSLGFKLPETSRERYGVAGCVEEFSRAIKLNRGNDWKAGLYVGGQRVTGIRAGNTWLEIDLRFALDMLQEGDELVVRTEGAGR